MSNPLPPDQMIWETRSKTYFTDGVPGTDVDMADWYNNGTYNFQWASIGGQNGIAVPQSAFGVGESESSIEWVDASYPETFVSDPGNVDLINSAMWYMQGHNTGLSYDDFISTYGGYFPTFASGWSFMGVSFDFYIDNGVPVQANSGTTYPLITQLGDISGGTVPLYLFNDTASVVDDALPVQTWHNQSYPVNNPDPVTKYTSQTFADFLVNDVAVPGSALIGATMGSADLQTTNGWPTYYRNVIVTYSYWTASSTPVHHHNHIGGSEGLQGRDKGFWHPVNNLGL